jgi:hypothetical protein
LKDDCGLRSVAVYGIVKKLSQDPDFKAALGKKITTLWLKYKIYEVLDIKSAE